MYEHGAWLGRRKGTRDFNFNELELQSKISARYAGTKTARITQHGNMNTGHTHTKNKKKIDYKGTDNRGPATKSLKPATSSLYPEGKTLTNKPCSSHLGSRDTEEIQNVAPGGHERAQDPRPSSQPAIKKGLRPHLYYHWATTETVITHLLFSLGKTRPVSPPLPLRPR